jgi:hypothetical protein
VGWNFRQHLRGLFFIDGNLNQHRYLDLLQMEVGPELDALRDNGEIIFQHDGAPAHSAANVREFLNETFPDSWMDHSVGLHEVLTLHHSIFFFMGPFRNTSLRPHKRSTRNCGGIKGKNN